jgi:hypothetical protein
LNVKARWNCGGRADVECYDLGKGNILEVSGVKIFGNYDSIGGNRDVRCEIGRKHQKYVEDLISHSMGNDVVVYGDNLHSIFRVDLNAYRKNLKKVLRSLLLLTDAKLVIVKEFTPFDLLLQRSCYSHQNPDMQRSWNSLEDFYSFRRLSRANEIIRDVAEQLRSEVRTNKVLKILPLWGVALGAGETSRDGLHYLRSSFSCSDPSDTGRIGIPSQIEVEKLNSDICSTGLRHEFDQGLTKFWKNRATFNNKFLPVPRNLVPDSVMWVGMTMLFDMIRSNT